MAAMPNPADPQHRSETYRGVQLSVWAYPHPKGWSWTYLAGDYQGRMRGALLADAGKALTQAMRAARARVDLEAPRG